MTAPNPRVRPIVEPLRRPALRLLGRKSNTSGGPPVDAPNLVAEDGSTLLLAEDGLTQLVAE